MPFGPLFPGRFLARRNRFAAAPAVAGAVRLVHVPNSGRLRELLRPGAAVRVRPGPAARSRQTWGDLCLVRHAGRWVCVDTRVAVAVVAAALDAGCILELGGWRVLRREVRVGRHRFDLMLARGHRRALCEVKSVTLVEERVAGFPDAPTTRGAAHLTTLAARAPGGGRRRRRPSAFSSSGPTPSPSRPIRRATPPSPRRAGKRSRAGSRFWPAPATSRPAGSPSPAASLSGSPVGGAASRAR